MKKLLSTCILLLITVTVTLAQWSIDSMSTPRFNMLEVKFTTEALFVTGTWDKYNISSQAWTNGSLSEIRNAMHVAKVGTKAYFAGGWKGPFTDPVYVNTIDIYNSQTSTWSTAKLSVAREVGAAAALKNKVYFAGGRDALTMKKRVDIINTSTGLKTSANLSKARTNIAVGVNGNKIVFAGGWYFDFYCNHVLSNAVDICDAATGHWSKATLSQKREEISVAVVGNKILFAGGFTDSGSGISKNVDIYDVSSNTWTTAFLSVPRYEITVNVVGSKAYFAGSGNGVGSIDVYDASNGSWSVISMPVTLVSMAGTVINDEIFYAGGYDPSTYAVSNLIQVYNITSGTWTTQNLSQARAGIAVVTLNDETLFAGGATKVTYPGTGSKRVDIYTTPVRASMNAPTEAAFEMKVYPNPASDQLHIVLPQAVQFPLELSVYDGSGKMIISFNANDYDVILPVKFLAAGNYVIEGNDAGNNRYSSMVIKQ